MKLALLGVPWDANSSFLRGPAEAPARIREALHSGAMNLCAEDGTDLSAEPRLVDAGDVRFETPESFLGSSESTARGLLQSDHHLLSLGGDHSVTLPLVRAHAAVFGPLEILHLDAHPDLYHELDGNRLSHASPFARIMEEGLVSRLVQVGIRTLNPHQRLQAARFGVETYQMRDWNDATRFSFKGPLYISLDLDALDPAFAPGVSHHEPGGFTTRQIFEILRHLPVSPVGADLVEFNPTRDPIGITAALAAKLVKELQVKLLEGLG